ncbi:MAG: hypothetical protein GPJ54_01575 [Candidatus Heimdallarchaeota archaeon]|nr:hypothetical protein [Candidatus Heimdallarchaeota archaeon]
MTEAVTEQSIETFYQIEASHWSFMLALFVGFFIADQLYSLIENIAPIFIEKLNVFTGSYTYPVLISVMILLVVKLISLKLPEMNINHRPQTWVWITAIMILSHPLLLFQNREKLTVEFEIFGMIKRTFDGSNELFVFIFSSTIYIFAGFGVLQILYLSEKKDNVENKKLSESISLDRLPLYGVILIIIYFFQSLASSGLEEVDFSHSIKIIIFIIFSSASMPNTKVDPKLVDQLDSRIE